MIRRGRELAVPRVERADVCVIGSGAGGAVAAAVLAEAGREVVVLEQGGHHTSGDFDQREERMLPLLFQDAAMSTTQDGGIGLLHGRTVGGSTVHNLCLCMRAPRPVLELWQEAHGVRELEDLDASFARVEAGLSVRPILPEELNALNRRIRRGAQQLGYRGHIPSHNRAGCVRSGFCLLGCSYDAKRSMLVTYVPRADRAGARIYADCRVERIAGGAGARRVEATLQDGRGRERGRLSVDAPVVVCSAGALATPVLLRASGLASASEALGGHLHLHPTALAYGVFEETLNAHYGIPQAYYVDEFMDLASDPYAGYALMPLAIPPAATAAMLPGFGPGHFERMRAYGRLGGVMALLHDRSEGRVHGRGRVSYALDEDDRSQLAAALKRVVELLWVSGAERVIVPYFEDPLELRPGDGVVGIDRRGVREGLLPLLSTHPQGSCRMGTDPVSSVVGSFGELHDAPGVFVADASVFPTSLGAPPQLTTAALADRTAHHVLERWPDFGAGAE